MQQHTQISTCRFCHVTRDTSTMQLSGATLDAKTTIMLLALHVTVHVFPHMPCMQLSSAMQHTRHTACTGTCRDKQLLNGAIRAHLVQEGYKLTALTLSEEGSGCIPDVAPAPDCTLAAMLQAHSQKSAAAAAQHVRPNQQHVFAPCICLLSRSVASRPATCSGQLQ